MTIVIPTWFAWLIAPIVLAPAIIFTCAAAWCVHFCYLRFFRPFTWARKNLHML